MISISFTSWSAPPVPIQNIIEANRLFLELDFCREREVIHLEKIGLLETEIGHMQELLSQATFRDSIQQKIYVSQLTTNSQLAEQNTRLRSDITTARRTNRVVLTGSGILLVLLLIFR